MDLLRCTVLVVCAEVDVGSVFQETEGRRAIDPGKVNQQMFRTFWRLLAQLEFVLLITYFATLKPGLFYFDLDFRI